MALSHLNESRIILWEKSRPESLSLTPYMR